MKSQVFASLNIFVGFATTIASLMESLWQSHKALGRAVAHKRLILSILPKTPCRQKGARSKREAIDYQHVMRHKNQYPEFCTRALLVASSVGGIGKMVLYAGKAAPS